MEVYILGSSSALSSRNRDNSFLAVEIGKELIMIDCAAGPARKLLQINKNFQKINYLLITHIHPDHVYGIPSLIHELILKGRKQILQIFCPDNAEPFLNELINLYFRDEEYVFPIKINSLTLKNNSIIHKTKNFKIFACPIIHGLGALAFRIDGPNGESLSYSGDTSPSKLFIELSKGVDLLIHEAMFPSELDKVALSKNHSTAKQAAHVALECKAKYLILVHMDPPYENIFNEMYNNARNIFGENIDLGEDLACYKVLPDSVTRI